MPPVDASSEKAVEPTIRDATLADAAAIAEIYNVYVQQGGATMDQVEKEPGFFRRQMEQFSNREALLVLEFSGVLIGWGVIKAYSDRIGYCRTCETSVYLRPGWTGRGLGVTMKQAMIERCRVFGYHHLVAKILAGNQACLAYLLKLGYEAVGVQREVGHVKGVWVDVIILQLILEDITLDQRHPAGGKREADGK